MCKCLSLSHIAKIHIILIKQTIFSKKLKKKGDQVSDLLCLKLSELLYDSCKFLKYLQEFTYLCYDPNSSMLPLSDVCLSVALPENTLLILKHLYLEINIPAMLLSARTHPFATNVTIGLVDSETA